MQKIGKKIKKIKNILFLLKVMEKHEGHDEKKKRLFGIKLF